MQLHILIVQKSALLFFHGHALIITLQLIFIDFLKSLDLCLNILFHSQLQILDLHLVLLLHVFVNLAQINELLPILLRLVHEKVEIVLLFCPEDSRAGHDFHLNLSRLSLQFNKFHAFA